MGLFNKKPGQTNYYSPRRTKVHPAILISACALVLVGVLVFAIVQLTRPAPGELTPMGTAAPEFKADRSGLLESPTVQAAPVSSRFIGFGSQDFQFSEKYINQPAIYQTEIVFSAGTGTTQLNKLFYYNLDTGEEKRLAQSTIYMGEYYETLISDDWIVWLETDSGKKNNIYTMNRQTGAISLVKTIETGKPKLRLSGDLLIWMEQVESNLDQLYMFHLSSQENLSLFEINEISTYGVSAPYIYDDTVVWAGKDTEQTDEDREANGEKSFIYYVDLNEDTFSGDGGLNYNTYQPGTYVHEPAYNGEYFIWIDKNKAPNSKLYIGKPGEEPKIIDRGVTTYSMGDGIVVYGHNHGVWLYVIETGEICRLTREGEKASQPLVANRTVVWYNHSAEAGKDVLRYKVLSDEDIFPQWPR